MAQSQGYGHFDNLPELFNSKTRRLGMTEVKPLLLNCLTGSVTLEVVKRKMLKDPIRAIICVSSTEKCNYSAGGARWRGFEQPAWNNALLSAWSNSGRKTERLLSGLGQNYQCLLRLGIVSIPGVHWTHSPSFNTNAAVRLDTQINPQWPTTLVFALQLPHPTAVEITSRQVALRHVNINNNISPAVLWFTTGWSWCAHRPRVGDWVASKERKGKCS